jgi:hypothetical protein
MILWLVGKRLAPVYNDLLPNTTCPRPRSSERLLTTLFALSLAWVTRLTLPAWQQTAASAERQRSRQVSLLMRG